MDILKDSFVLGSIRHKEQFAEKLGVSIGHVDYMLLHKPLFDKPTLLHMAEVLGMSYDFLEGIQSRYYDNLNTSLYRDTMVVEDTEIQW